MTRIKTNKKEREQLSLFPSAGATNFKCPECLVLHVITDETKRDIEASPNKLTRIKCTSCNCSHFITYDQNKDLKAF